MTTTTTTTTTNDRKVGLKKSFQVKRNGQLYVDLVLQELSLSKQMAAFNVAIENLSL